MQVKGLQKALRRVLPALAFEEEGASGKAFVLRVTLWTSLVRIALLSIQQSVYHPEQGEVQFLVLPSFLHIQSIVRDISERKALEAQLRRQAFYDSLTNLPNRALFENRLTQAVARAKRSQTTLAVLFLDFDKFKQVNDRYGHQTGDRTLQKLAARMQASVRERDTVARLGGDEFAIIVDHPNTKPEVENLIGRILSCFGKPYKFNDHKVSLTASIGIALFPQDAKDRLGLLKQADDAMYVDKEKGKNQFHFPGR